MKIQHNLSIRSKIIIMVNGVLLLAFILAALIVRKMVYEHIVDEKIATTEILMKSLVHDIKYNYEIREGESVQVVINKYMTYYRRIKKISFFDTRLTDIADSTFSDMGQRTKDPLIVDAIKAGRPATNVTRYNRYTIRVDAISPVFQGTRIVGAVSMGIAVDDIDATLKAFDKNMIIIMTVLFLFACLSLFVLLKKTILQRLSHLLRGTYQIAQGEYEINIPYTGMDEIGELASAFNQMANDIKKSRNDLQQYNEHLEKMVQDRTVQLQHYSERLEEMVQNRTTELQKAYDDLKNTHSQLVLSEKMASLGVLIAGIAHEINTPLGAINNISRNVHNKILLLAQSLKQIEERKDRDSDKMISFLDYVMKNSMDIPNSIPWAKKRQVENFLKEKGIDHYKEVSGILINLNILDSEKIEYFLDCILDEKIFSMIRSFGDIIQAAKICETSSQKISDIVRALKYYAYTDKDKVESININESIENSLILLRNKLKYTVDVTTCFAEDLPAIYCTSEINQIWPNLITNAYDAICAMGEDYKGEIRIETSHIKDHVVVKVIDNGIGIQTDIINKIFDPFFTTKDIGKGTGLGLSIVSGIIKKHNGAIRVESIKGSTLFEVSLPIEVSVVSQCKEGI